MDLTQQSRCLPLELLRPIAESVRIQSDLLPLALVSSVFREEAQRVLFRAPTLSTTLSHDIFLKAIIESPTRLALFVETYTRFSVHHNGASWALRRSLRACTGDALKAMVNLSELTLYLLAGHHPSSLATDLCSCTFRLRSFRWACYGRDEARVILQEFLPQQPALRELDLLNPWASNHVHIPKSLCPNLQSFAGPVNLSSRLLIGRDIKQLKWITDFDRDTIDADPDKLPRELQNVEILIYDNPPPNISFSSVAHRLVSVKFLQIDYSYANCAIFSQMPKLSAVLLSFDSDHFSSEAGRVLGVTTSLFAQCAALKYVDLDVGGSTVYIRYTISGNEGGKVDAIDIPQEQAQPWSDIDCFGFS